MSKNRVSSSVRKLIDDFPEYDIKQVIQWKLPDEKDLRSLITMPNIPKPLHGVAPRVVLGNVWWNRARNVCYLAAQDTCEICGAKPEEKRNRHAHELYKVNWRLGETEFIRPVCVCYNCHCLCIHTGRAITLYKKNNPIFPADTLLAGAEHAFTIISSYNADHADRPPIRAYGTWLEYLRQPDLEKPMRELIDKYGIKFYVENPKRMAKWGEWRLKIGEKYYPTPYANEKEWAEAMEKASKTDTYRQVKSPLTGGIFDTIDEIIKNS